MLWLWSAFSLGLFGSLHCLGMCGPIAMALPLNTSEKISVYKVSALYNIGRVSSYTLMGLLMGILGWGVFLTGYQKSLSVILGILMILTAFYSGAANMGILKNLKIEYFYSRAQATLASFLSNKRSSSAYKIGFANGFLPCGMVYVALAGALTTSDVLTSAGFMAFFGFGTWPLMAAAMIFSNLNRSLFLRMRKALPLVMFIFGLMLIQRGINLQVPLELKFWEAFNNPIMCH